MPVPRDFQPFGLNRKKKKERKKEKKARGVGISFGTVSLTNYSCRPGETSSTC